MSKRIIFNVKFDYKSVRDIKQKYIYFFIRCLSLLCFSCNMKFNFRSSMSKEEIFCTRSAISLRINFMSRYSTFYENDIWNAHKKYFFSSNFVTINFKCFKTQTKSTNKLYFMGLVSKARKKVPNSISL